MKKAFLITLCALSGIIFPSDDTASIASSTSFDSSPEEDDTTSIDLPPFQYAPLQYAPLQYDENKSRATAILESSIDSLANNRITLFKEFNASLQWALNSNKYAETLCKEIRRMDAVLAQWDRLQSASQTQIQSSAQTLETLIAEEIKKKGYEGFNRKSISRQLFYHDQAEDSADFRNSIAQSLAPAYARLLFALGYPFPEEVKKHPLSFHDEDNNELKVSISDRECHYFIVGLLCIAYRDAYETSFGNALDAEAHATLKEREAVYFFKRRQVFPEREPATDISAETQSIILTNAKKKAHEVAAKAVTAMISSFYAALIEIRLRLEPLTIAESPLDASQALDQQTQASILAGIAASTALLFFHGNNKAQRKKVLTPTEVAKALCQELKNQGADTLRVVAKENKFCQFRAYIARNKISFINNATLEAREETKGFLAMHTKSEIAINLKTYIDIAMAEDYLNGLAWGTIIADSDSLQKTLEALSSATDRAKKNGSIHTTTTEDIYASINAQIDLFIGQLPAPMLNELLPSSLKEISSQLTTPLLIVANQILWLILLLKIKNIKAALMQRSESVPHTRLLAAAGAPERFSDSVATTTISSLGDQTAYAMNALQFEKNFHGALEHANASVSIILETMQQMKQDLLLIKTNLSTVMARTEAFIDAAIAHATNVSDLGAHSVEKIKNIIQAVQGIMEKALKVPVVGEIANKKIAQIIAGGGKDYAQEEIQRRLTVTASELSLKSAALLK